jgi:hypothetical protein
VRLRLQLLRNLNLDELYRVGVAALESILGRIIQNPMDERYRRIRCANPGFQRRLGRLAGADNLMLACGFVLDRQQEEDQWVFPPSPENWPVLLENKAEVGAAAAAGPGATPTSEEASATTSRRRTMQDTSPHGTAERRTRPRTAQDPMSHTAASGNRLPPAGQNALVEHWVDQTMADPSLLQEVVQVTFSGSERLLS